MLSLDFRCLIVSHTRSEKEEVPLVSVFAIAHVMLCLLKVSFFKSFLAMGTVTEIKCWSSGTHRTNNWPWVLGCPPCRDTFVQIAHFGEVVIAGNCLGCPIHKGGRCGSGAQESSREHITWPTLMTPWWSIFTLTSQVLYIFYYLSIPSIFHHYLRVTVPLQSSQGPPTGGACPEHLTREASGRHPN